MSRVEEIVNLQSTVSLVESFGLVAAYCNCLSPEEACELLRCTVSERHRVRDSAIKKVCLDIEHKILRCHESMIEGFFSSFTEADHRGRQSLGFALSRVADVSPPHIRKRIQELFLSSSYVVVRRRGYKIASNHFSEMESSITQAWKKHGDPEGAWLITKHYPAKFLSEYREEIEDQLSEGWQYSRLYLRIAETDESVLEILKSRDVVSYCYVLSRLGKVLDEGEAGRLIEKAIDDERFGLFVWTLGKMGLWNTLKKIEKKLPEIEEHQIFVHTRKDGI